MELFPLERKYPAGFQYVPDFITTEEEDYLLDAIGRIALHTFNFHGFDAKRRVASFGYDYSFSNRTLTKGEPIPTAFDPLLSKVSLRLNIPKEEFVELLVTEYPLGSVINWHRDAPPFEVIVGISLNSDCIFRLRPYQKKLQGRNSLVSFPIERKSLYVIAGESRMQWEHSTSPVKNVRYSITLRTLKTPA